MWMRLHYAHCRPAQILSKAAARQHLGGVAHKSAQDTPVIFFGTSEVGWIGQKDVTEWEAGMQQHFHVKGRKNKKFVTSLEQVSLFDAFAALAFLKAAAWGFPSHTASSVCVGPLKQQHQQQVLWHCCCAWTALPIGDQLGSKRLSLCCDAEWS